jgi:hypothetical protein
MGGIDLSDGICALLAIRLVSIIVGLRLPQVASGRFKAMISCDPVPGFGRVEPPADVGVARWLVTTPSGPSPPSAFGTRNLRFRIAIAAAQAQVLQGVPVLYPRGWLATHARISIEPPYGV